MDLDDFIKNCKIDVKVNREDLPKVQGDNNKVLIVGTALMISKSFLEFAQAIQSENTKLLECMPCGCKKATQGTISNTKFVPDIIQCPRCKLLEERKEVNDGMG